MVRGPGGLQGVSDFLYGLRIVCACAWRESLDSVGCSAERLMQFP